MQTIKRPMDHPNFRSLTNNERLVVYLRHYQQEWDGIADAMGLSSAAARTLHKTAATKKLA